MTTFQPAHPGQAISGVTYPCSRPCVAAGLDYMAVCRFMGHSKPTTTLAIYTHLFNTDDHADAMAAMAAAPKYGTNVVSLHG